MDISNLSASGNELVTTTSTLDDVEALETYIDVSYVAGRVGAVPIPAASKVLNHQIQASTSEWRSRDKWSRKSAVDHLRKDLKYQLMEVGLQLLQQEVAANKDAPKHMWGYVKNMRQYAEKRRGDNYTTQFPSQASLEGQATASPAGNCSEDGSTQLSEPASAYQGIENEGQGTADPHKSANDPTFSIEVDREDERQQMWNNNKVGGAEDVGNLIDL